MAEVKREVQARLKRTGSRYKLWQRRYWSDPVGFAQDCIIWDEDECLAPYQEEILSYFPDTGRVSVRGPHGLGKTMSSAILLLWFSLTRDGSDWKVLTTASAWRQLIKYLWPEIHKWSRRLNWELIGRDPFGDKELMNLSLRLSTGEAFAVASDRAELIEGAHADQLFYIFDEAKVIPDDTWDSAEGAFSTGAGDMGKRSVYALSISTPGNPLGRFYDIQVQKPGLQDWKVRHVTLEEAIAAGRINAEWAENRRLQWGERSQVYQNRVLGEFAASDTRGIIPYLWIEEALDRWETWIEAGRPGQVTSMGVDVGRGGDLSVIAEVYEGYKVDELHKSGERDTMDLVGKIMVLMGRHGNPTTIVDVIGVGSGVYDRLREQDKPVIPFNASNRTDFTDRSEEVGFVDMRSAAWWNFRELLDPAYGSKVALPPDKDLVDELITPKWRLMSNGKIKVDSKDDILRTLGRSTDSADAVIMACMLKHLSEGNTVDIVGFARLYANA